MTKKFKFRRLLQLKDGGEVKQEAVGITQSSSDTSEFKVLTPQRYDQGKEG